MRSGEEIYLNYQDTLNKAERLEAVAAELERALKNHIQGVEGQLNAGWEGDAQKVFTKRNIRLQRRAESRIRQIRSTADLLRKTADSYYRLEKMASGIFGGR